MNNNELEKVEQKNEVIEESNLNEKSRKGKTKKEKKYVR